MQGVARFEVVRDMLKLLRHVKLTTETRQTSLVFVTIKAVLNV
jgi:hypothetical protein